MRFGETKIAKEKFNIAKKPINIWDVNNDNIVISKLIETKTNSKYLIKMKFDEAIRPLVLIMPKMSGYVKTFKIKEEIKIKTINDVFMRGYYKYIELFGLRLKI